MIKEEEKIRREVANEIINYEKSLSQEDFESRNTFELIANKRRDLLNSDEVNKLGEKIAQEDIKSDFANRASQIHERNVGTAERELDLKKREKQLEREDAELELIHQYKMAAIKKDNEHRAMLDSRKKMVDKYGYLYENKETITAIDGDGKQYQLPKDFSFSEHVNKIRQFGRNVSKLDKPLLQTIKWIFIAGTIILGVFILKWTGVIG